MDDKVPLEFDLAIGVRKTDAFLKYMLEFALEDKKDEIEKILKDYGVPLVQCSRCLVPGRSSRPWQLRLHRANRLQSASGPGLARPGGHAREGREMARGRAPT